MLATLSLVAAGLGHVADKITSLTRPCYRLRRKIGVAEQLPIGTSRLGGSPDVPAGFVWPQTTNTRSPEDMEFVAQIRLTDLPPPLPEPLPPNGLLSFFTRWSEGRVFYFPEGTVLGRTVGPNPPVEVFSLLIQTDHRDLGAMVRYDRRAGGHDLLAGVNFGKGSVDGGNYRNFGIFLSIYDWLFGTLHIPQGRPSRYGIPDPTPHWAEEVFYPLYRGRSSTPSRSS